MDFLDLLLADYLEADAAAEGTMQALPLAYLLGFVAYNCAILSDLPDHSPDDAAKKFWHSLLTSLRLCKLT